MDQQSWETEQFELLTRVIDVSVCFVALRNGASLKIEYVHDHGETRPDPAIVIERGSRSWETMRTEQLYVSLGVILVLGVGSNVVLQYLAARFIPWRVERDQ